MADEDDNVEEPDEETKELMVNYDLDIDEAEEVKDIMDEYGVDEDDAFQLRDEL